MSSNRLVLVVDDEPSICWALERLLAEEGYRVATASTAEEGLRLAADERPSMVILDVRLPGEDGLSALPRFVELTDNAPVLVVTAFGDLETAVTAVKRGATDYLTKPFRLDDVLRVCRRTLEGTKPEEAPSTVGAMPIDNSVLVGTSPAMQQVFRQIALVAGSDLSVLITGETGTGKELVAAAIHRHSERANRPYMPISPVALNPDLIESELFGHLKGSFTGATRDREGLFSRGEGGTVFLDEIGDLPLAMQVKLLRVLEQGQYCPVGDIHPRTANVRVLAATSRDLHEGIRLGDFREDLFHRLTGMRIHLPPLRDRTEDIRPLCFHFLKAMGYPSADRALNGELIAALGKRNWHGNVRELRNAIGHAAVIARGRALSIDDFPPPTPGRETNETTTTDALRDAVTGWVVDALDTEADLPLQTRFLDAVEPALLAQVLKHTGGNRAKAAEILGIHRGTLRDRLRGYGLDEDGDGTA